MKKLLFATVFVSRILNYVIETFKGHFYRIASWSEYTKRNLW